MESFAYKRGRLHCESVDLHRIAEETGTPTYVYSKAAVLARYQEMADAFAELAPLICYSVKSNWNLALMRCLKGAGAGFDIVSAGELVRALKVGADPRKIVFAGVGKRDDEIRFALDSNILMFNVESVAELEAINAAAKAMGKTAEVALRLNPDVDAKTHKKTTTGTKENKFGIGLAVTREILKKLKRLRNVQWTAVHLHLGSPIYSSDPYKKAIRKVTKLLPDFLSAGASLQYLNIGGGYCMSYTGEDVIRPVDYAGDLIPLIKKTGLKLVMEPGRFIVANAGVLLTHVTYRKTADHGKQFVIVDAAMTDLIRPALYGSFHRIWPAKCRYAMPDIQQDGDKPKFAGKLELVDVVGPVCESSDFLAQRRYLPVTRQGDLLCVFSAGAYGMAMASNYNTRLRPAEILVDGTAYKVVRRRETYEDLLAPEEL